ncbi:MAG: type II CAAX endopeptidase family protein [Pseudomonadota bacterium]
MKRWFESILKPGTATASAPLVFLTLTLVTLFQFPTQLLLRAGFVSLGVAANEIIAVAGVPLAIIALLRFNRRRLLPLERPSIAVLALTAVVTISAAILIDYMTAGSEHFFPLPPEVSAAYDRIMAISGPADAAIKLVVLCLLPAFCEELFFRGFCQTSLSARWGDWPAIAITALFFAILHGNPWYFHLYSILGLLLGWIYALTGTLWAPILCHLINNSWSFINHMRGFELPLSHPFGRPDAILLAAAVLVFFAFAAILRRRCAPVRFRA